MDVHIDNRTYLALTTAGVSVQWWRGPESCVQEAAEAAILVTLGWGGIVIVMVHCCTPTLWIPASVSHW